MKFHLFLIAGILMASCAKNDWTCKCTVETQTKPNSSNITTVTTNTEEFTVMKTTKKKAEAGGCASTKSVATYSNQTVTAERTCKLK